mmetsp:Transcript_62074/g.192277  ORF Transcript_62074/g.192277 Transcript_62074/m.192277 type:complete len:298 (-) Transcript_62074:205-1098(-)
MVPSFPASRRVPLSRFVTVRSAISEISSDRQSLVRKTPSMFQRLTPPPAQVANRTPRGPESRTCRTFRTGSSFLSGWQNSMHRMSVLSRITRTSPLWPATATSQGPCHMQSTLSLNSAMSMSLTPPMPRFLIERTSSGEVPPSFALGRHINCRLPFEVPLMKGPSIPAQATAVTPKLCTGPTFPASRARSISGWFSSSSTSCTSTARSLYESLAARVTSVVNGTPVLPSSSDRVLSSNRTHSRRPRSCLISPSSVIGKIMSWCVMSCFSLLSTPAVGSSSASLTTTPAQRCPSSSNL